MTKTNKHDKRLQTILKRVETLAKDEKELFLDEHKRVEALARTIPILILADHKKDDALIKKIISNLIDKHHHTAVSLKAVARKGNHIHSEKLAIRETYRLVYTSLQKNMLDNDTTLNKDKVHNNSSGKNGK